MWVILWRPLLLTYRWPQEETNYTDGYGHSAVKSHAGFEDVAVIIESLERRLKRAGPDGETLVHELANGLTLATISKAAQHALNYCVGREKQDNITEWERKKEWQRRHATFSVASKPSSNGGSRS